MAFDNRTYRRALEAQTKRIGDYERVHFRKSYVPKIYDSVAGFEPTRNARNPDRPLLQPRVLEFSRATAKAFLQQTESLWLKYDYSRQDATKELLDRKTGSFFLRSSTKAKYALTVRLEDNNPPVMHFLVHCNDQGFYIIQGSNLQFVSLYDMLAFFCFQQSGGMPCLLRPPVVRSNRDLCLLESEDSDSEAEEEEEENGEALVSPPASLPKYDEIRFKEYGNNRPSQSNKPPPVPPRRRFSPYFDVTPEMLDRVSRVSSLVDNDTGTIIHRLKTSQNLLERPCRTREQWTPPTPAVGETNKSYNNFQIINSHDKTLSEHYETAVKEFVAPVFATPPNVDNRPPAIPPKSQPPPIPPKSNHGVFQSQNSKAPPPIPPKPKPRTWTQSESETDVRLPNRLGHRRVSSDSSVVSGMSEDVPAAVSPPPPLPPNHPKVTEEVNGDNKDKVKKNESFESEVTSGWTFVTKPETTDVSPPVTPTTAGGSSTHSSRIKWKKPRWAKKLRKWGRKPRSKVKHYILDLSNDTSTVFGARVHYFRETALIRTDPHQKLFSDVRKFMGNMRDLLLTDYKTDLLSIGMDSCQNFEHLLESTLQQCIILPLHSFLYSTLRDHLVQNGSIDQMRNAITSALSKTPDELGIRPHLLAPNDRSLQEINNIFNKLKESYNAMRKMEYLLEAVRLTYEGVRDANNPKKAMHDLGADDFLPLFVWVLAHTNFETAEIEAEYIWGLAHPSLFNGEGGYYLTTLTSAVNVLKECCVDNSIEATDSKDGDTFEDKSKDIPNINRLKTQLSVSIQDPNTGIINNPTSLPVLPTMAVSEICDSIAIQYNITNPEQYGLYIRGASKVTKLNDDDYPQEMNLGWELQSSPEDDRPILVYMKEQ